MIHQLNPPLPVITPKGKALAHVVIDMGIEHDLQWICFQDGTGECWTWSNENIRAQVNISHGRNYISPFYNPEDVALKKDCEYCGENEEDCSCGSCENPVDYEKVYEEKIDEVNELKENMKDALDENKFIKTNLNSLIELLKKLFNDDQIHPNQREEVREYLLKFGEVADGFYGRLVNKSPSD